MLKDEAAPIDMPAGNPADLLPDLPGKSELVAYCDAKTMTIGGPTGIGTGSAAIFVNAKKVGEMHSGVCDFGPLEINANDIIELVRI